jgi:ATP-dependent Clp protease ATP-binding subunit ClpC
LLSEGTDPDYGARPLRRAIQRLVEDPLSDLVLRGEFKEARHESWWMWTMTGKITFKAPVTQAAE